MIDVYACLEVLYNKPYNENVIKVANCVYVAICGVYMKYPASTQKILDLTVFRSN